MEDDKAGRQLTKLGFIGGMIGVALLGICAIQEIIQFRKGR